MRVADVVDDLLGADPPVRVDAYDGSSWGPADAPCVLTIRSPRALRRIIAAPGELGLARAYVSGELDVEGDIYAGLGLRDRFADLRIGPRHLAGIARVLGRELLQRPPEPPPEEVRLSGRRHARDRDAAAIAAHYDISNAFYEMVLGPAMTYSCGVFRTPDDDLFTAQWNKHELVCTKLGLTEGDRLLDIGCGWGSMAIHAARHHGTRVVGVTLSRAQLELGRKLVTDAGVADLVELRLQDYREVDDGPFDAISSIGMAEHVGWSRIGDYCAQLARLVRPGGRVLNHAISNADTRRPRRHQDGFLARYVFPDGELMHVGIVAAELGAAGLEVRHVESLREHYALTLRRWVAHLEANWDDAVAEVGPGRARVWRLYMAAAALNFEAGRTAIHQTLAVRPAPDGTSGLPLRPVLDLPRG